MARDDEYPERGYNTEDVRAVPPNPARPKRRWWLWGLGVLVVGPGALFALWSAITLSVAYSHGERAGVVQKFSRKGWVCKTWEGELVLATIPGAVPEKFAFTVRDDSVAQVVNTLYRQGVRTSIAYDEHRGVPTACFGDTRYFATGAEAIGGPAAGTLPGAVDATAPNTGVPPAPVPRPSAPPAQTPTAPAPAAPPSPAPPTP
jgi:hypothetical protein